MRALPLLVALLLTATPTSAQDAEDAIQVLADELARLREQLAVPETDVELQSLYGMGPAASKVYATPAGISLGGYGEFHFASPLEQTDQTGAVNTADFYRFITYFGYKFSDSIVMNTEIEFEHATTSSNFAGRSGSVSVEFSYLDFLIADSFNVRAGNLLVPVGVVNEMHEPAFYRGNFRPAVEQQIIPSTWRELGMGAHGRVGERVRYTAYVVNGLNGAKFSGQGVRDGRQKGNRAVWEDVAAVVAVMATPHNAVTLGASFYGGGADHGQIQLDDSAVSVSNTILEAHATVRKGGFEAKALVAQGHIEGAGDLTNYLNSLDVDDEDPDVLIPTDQLGFYLEAAFDVAPLLLGEDSTAQVSPWIRWENYNLQEKVPGIDGLSADGNLDVTLVTVGVDVKPHPNVVLKLDFVHSSNAADSPTSDELRLGAGFVY